MRFLIAVALIATLGCSTSPTDPQAAGGTVPLRYGETKTIADRRIAFTDVVDSRCPKEVVCAWAGDAAVRLESGSESLVLHTNLTSGAAAGTLAGLTITLVEVRPEPVGLETKKTDYVVTIRVSG